MTSAGRARSFGGIASLYDRSRTGYAGDDVAWALGRDTAARVDHGSPAVVELAAGTGLLTGALLDLPDGPRSVDAVEPDPRMRAEFARRIRDPRVRLHDGTAEAVPLPDGCADAVVAGSAFHWFDPGTALPELARLLVSGGVLAALWTGPDESVDWVRDYREAGRAALRTGRDGPPAPTPPADGVDRHRDIPPSPLFGPTQLRTATHVEAVAPEALAAAVGTYSEVLVADPGRQAAVLAAATEAVRRAVPVGARRPDGLVDLPVRVNGARTRLLRAP